MSFDAFLGFLAFGGMILILWVVHQFGGPSKEEAYTCPHCGQEDSIRLHVCKRE
jgi:hypothetical protein